MRPALKTNKQTNKKIPKEIRKREKSISLDKSAKIFEQVLVNPIQRLHSYTSQSSGIFSMVQSGFEIQLMKLHHIKRLKKNIHMISSTEAEGAFDKLQHALIIKTVSK